MKAMSQTMYIIVAAVVIIVTALIVLTIFGGGVGVVTPLIEAKATCQTQAASTCGAFKALPPTWSVQNIPVKDGSGVEMTSCALLVPEYGNKCPDDYTQINSNIDPLTGKREK